MKYVFLCVVFISILGCSENKIKSAGVVAYAENDVGRYILLADHVGFNAHRGYGSFGGGLDEGETIKEGALREFHEETGCHFVGKVLAISENYVRNKKYASFVVQVPFIEEAVLNLGPASTSCAGGVFSERANWVWVEQTLLLEQIKRGDHFKSDKLDISLWDKSTVIINKMFKAGML